MGPLKNTRRKFFKTTTAKTPNAQTTQRPPSFLTPQDLPRERPAFKGAKLRSLLSGGRGGQRRGLRCGARSRLPSLSDPRDRRQGPRPPPRTHRAAPRHPRRPGPSFLAGRVCCCCCRDLGRLAKVRRRREEEEEEEAEEGGWRCRLPASAGGGCGGARARPAGRGGAGCRRSPVKDAPLLPF